MSVEHTNGWNEWSRFVLKELERLNDRYERLDDKLDSKITMLSEELTKKYHKSSNDITMLKVKAGVWGALAGVIPALSALFYTLLKG